MKGSQLFSGMPPRRLVTKSLTQTLPESGAVGLLLVMRVFTRKGSVSPRNLSGNSTNSTLTPSPETVCCLLGRYWQPAATRRKRKKNTAFFFMNVFKPMSVKKGFYETRAGGLRAFTTTGSSVW